MATVRTEGASRIKYVVPIEDVPDWVEEGSSTSSEGAAACAFQEKSESHSERRRQEPRAATDLNSRESQRPKTAPEMFARGRQRRTERRTMFVRSANCREVPCTGVKATMRYAYTLNLGGEKFNIKKSMLDKTDGNLFKDLNPSHPSYDEATGEYFFDRSAVLFSSIYDFLGGGDFHFPHCFCPKTMFNELEFWKLSPDLLSPCCSKVLKDYLNQQESLRLLEKAIVKEKITPEQCAKMTRTDKWKVKIYDFLDDPDSSRYARVWVVLYTILVLTSITVACIVTVPEIRVPANVTVCQQYINSSSLVYNTCATMMPDYIWMTSVVLNMIFLVEILTKFFTFPGGKFKFFCSLLNLMDVIAVLVTLATNFTMKAEPMYWQSNVSSTSSVNALASVLRVGRVMQFFKHNKALRVLVLTLRFSKGDLMVLLFLFLVAMILYGVAIYVAEYEEAKQFNSIPEGMWWALITMTTVGYNDFRPVTVGGYVLGGACACLGVLITGSAIPLSASSFERLTSLSTLIGTRKSP